MRHLFLCHTNVQTNFGVSYSQSQSLSVFYRSNYRSGSKHGLVGKLIALPRLSTLFSKSHRCVCKHRRCNFSISHFISPLLVNKTLSSLMAFTPGTSPPTEMGLSSLCSSEFSDSGDGEYHCTFPAVHSDSGCN